MNTRPCRLSLYQLRSLLGGGCASTMMHACSTDAMQKIASALQPCSGAAHLRRSLSVSNSHKQHSFASDRRVCIGSSCNGFSSVACTKKQIRLVCCCLPDCCLTLLLTVVQHKTGHCGHEQHVIKSRCKIRAVSNTHTQQVTAWRQRPMLLDEVLQLSSEHQVRVAPLILCKT